MICRCGLTTQAQRPGPREQPGSNSQRLNFAVFILWRSVLRLIPGARVRCATRRAGPPNTERVRLPGCIDPTCLFSCVMCCRLTIQALRSLSKLIHFHLKNSFSDTRLGRTTFVWPSRTATIPQRNPACPPIWGRFLLSTTSSFHRWTAPHHLRGARPFVRASQATLPGCVRIR